MRLLDEDISPFLTGAMARCCLSADTKPIRQEGQGDGMIVEKPWLKISVDEGHVIRVPCRQSSRLWSRAPERGLFATVESGLVTFRTLVCRRLAATTMSVRTGKSVRRRVQSMPNCYCYPRRAGGVRGIIAMVAWIFGLSCLTSQAFAQRSAQQLEVDAGAIIKEMKDAKSLAACIKGEYRDILLPSAKDWLKAAKAPQYEGDQKILSRRNALRTLAKEIEAMPICAPSPLVPDQTGSSPPNSLPGSLTTLGSNAGEYATHSRESLFVGVSAGREAKASSYSTIAGHTAGYSVKASPYAVLLGASSGQSLDNASSAVAVGSSAGRQAKNADQTVFMGASAGYGAQNVDNSMFFGYAAGRWIKDNKFSIISGYAAGEYAHRSHNSVMAGAFAGYQADGSPRSVMIGRDAGMFANKAVSSIMIGHSAGRAASNVANPVFLGVGAGRAAANTTDIVLIGTLADAEPGIENAVGIGRGANPSRSNTWHIPESLDVGVGTSTPTSQLHTTRDVRFAALPNGVLVTDEAGNVRASSQLDDALKKIADLAARVDALEAGRCRP